MRARFTHDLIEGTAFIKINTCSESINYMPEIFGFIRDNGFDAKMTTDFYNVSFTIKDFDGAHLASKVPIIMQFISDVQHGSYKRK